MQAHHESRLLHDVHHAAAAACASRHFQVEGLEVELRAVDPASIAWVLKNLQPLPQPAMPMPRTRYAVTCIYSDDLIFDAIRGLNDTELVHIRRGGRDRFVRRSRPAPDVVVDCDPDEGVLWISELASNAIHLVVSSRTKHPALAFFSVTRELVTRYLAQEGWTLFHAGAVDTPDGALMVVGNGGAGKTSLLLALMCGGASFIANELLFARECADGVRVLGYPMAVAVGLGTAMQFAPLADRIDSPGELEFPRNRLKLSRIVNTPQEEWKDLEDKLQLLPAELSAILGAPAPVAGARLCAVVVPAVSKQPVQCQVEPLDRAAAAKVLSNNHIGLTPQGKHRPWLELNLRPTSAGGHAGLLSRLSGLHPARFRFGLALDKAHEMRSYADRLRSARASLPRALSA
jgi:hypothetical protein